MNRLIPDLALLLAAAAVAPQAHGQSLRAYAGASAGQVRGPGNCALTTAPMAWWLRGTPRGQVAGGTTATTLTLREQLKIAACDRSDWCLHAGFFTCGFHIACLVTHMPGVVSLCGLNAGVAAMSLAIIGLTNIGGCLAAGALGSRVRMKYILLWMYAPRAIAILVYLAAPKEPGTYYLFAAVLGATWLATVPPTAGLTSKLM